MKIDRLFSIVQILINKKNTTAKELAEHFDVSVRTIYRDIEILSANGIPIYSTQGKGGGISILDNYLVDKTLLSDAEQKQVLESLQSVNATGQVEVSESLIKLSNIFKKNYADWIEIDFSNWEQGDEEKKHFEMLKKSIMNCKLVEFSYFNNKGEMTRRMVEPIKLIFKGYRWYLYGFCRTRNDFRFFKLSRMENVEELEKTFIKRENIKINTRYNEGKTELVKVLMRINKSMAARVYDEFRSGIIDSKGEYFVVETELLRNEYLYTYLLGYGSDLEVLKPKEIRDGLEEEIRKILRFYSK